MKSHSHIATTNHKELAQKINRSGVVRLLNEEVEYLKSHLVQVAGICQPTRARELFEHLGYKFPEGFECDPVEGELDSVIERLKTATDKKNAAG